MSGLKLIGTFDGACNPNPGLMGIGCAIIGNDEVLAKVSKPAGHGTNNEAEWLALIALLELCIEQGVTEINIFGDSRLVIEQVTNRWRMKAENLRPLKAKAQKLALSIPGLRYEWIAREQNTIADELSKKALGSEALLPQP